ncbi:hypothetical protein [Singulisphaera sp. PoT]|uniref:hypothetical protein n=1 Tax=Singulisphaera sp. PoT TaxID=3411797 RepID=UPI003BF460E0
MLTLEKEKLGGLKIGPSTAFANMVKTLEKAERMVLAKKATTIGSRKKVKLRK